MVIKISNDFAGDVAHALNNVTSTLQAAEMFLGDLPSTEASDLVACAVEDAFADILGIAAAMELHSFATNFRSGLGGSGRSALMSGDFENILDELKKASKSIIFRHEGGLWEGALPVDQDIFRIVLICAGAGIRKASGADHSIECRYGWIHGRLASANGLEINLGDTGGAVMSPQSVSDKLFFWPLLDCLEILKTLNIQITLYENFSLRCFVAEDTKGPVHSNGHLSSLDQGRLE